MCTVPRHVLIVGRALAGDFSRAYRAVNTSVICHARADETLYEDLLQLETVGPGSEPDMWVERARLIHAEQPLDRVVAFGENEQLLAAVIANDLGLAGHHGVDVVTAVADKIEMRVRLSAHGLGTVAFAEVADPAALARFADAHPGTRLLVKPSMGSGSRGVSELRDLRQSEEAFEQAAAVACPVAGRRRVMVEEFRPGRQLSVECMSELGQHQVVAITQKYTDKRTFAEVGHGVPAQLPTDAATAVNKATVAALDALGVRNGPTHTEVVLARTGRVDIIETHTRLGGHGIPRLVEAALGVDLQALTFAQVAGSSVLSRLPSPSPRQTGPAQAVWFGYAPVAGRVHSVQTGTPAGVRLDVLVKNGDVVTADMTRSSRVVTARASGQTEADAIRKAAEAVWRVRVVIECSMTVQLLERSDTPTGLALP